MTLKRPLPPMTFELNDEQRAFQDMARQFAGEEIAPYAAAWDEAMEFPVATLRKAAALGLAGIYVRAASGGSGLTRFDAAVIFEELAAACPSRSEEHTSELQSLMRNSYAVF